MNKVQNKAVCDVCFAWRVVLMEGICLVSAIYIIFAIIYLSYVGKSRQILFWPFQPYPLQTDRKSRIQPCNLHTRMLIVQWVVPKSLVTFNMFRLTYPGQLVKCSPYKSRKSIHSSAVKRTLMDFIGSPWPSSYTTGQAQRETGVGQRRLYPLDEHWLNSTILVGPADNRVCIGLSQFSIS